MFIGNVGRKCCGRNDRKRPNKSNRSDNSRSSGNIYHSFAIGGIFNISCILDSHRENDKRNRKKD